MACVREYDNETNMTGLSGDEKDEALYITYNVLLALITITIMFSMGTSITVHDLKIILKKPVGPVVGFVCQCIILPAVCFGYALLLSLPDNLAIGMVLTGSCPGGSISNIIAFWAKADICLSITMTTISTTLAIGFLPLNMFIYTRYWIKDPANIPFVNMVITVLYMWAACIIGFFVGRRWPKIVPYLTKIGSVLSLLMILSAGVVQGQLYPELFDLGWEAWFGAISLPIIGFIIGFILALIFCQTHPQRLAIGLETGVQNTALALTVIAVTFPSSYEASCYSQFTILYTTWQVVLGIATILGIWVYNMIRYRETPCAISRKQLLAREEELGGGHHESGIDEATDKIEAFNVEGTNPDDEEEKKDGDGYTTFGEVNNNKDGELSNSTDVKPVSQTGEAESPNAVKNDVIQVKEINSGSLTLNLESPPVTKL